MAKPLLQWLPFRQGYRGGQEAAEKKYSRVLSMAASKIAQAILLQQLFKCTEQEHAPSQHCTQMAAGSPQPQPRPPTNTAPSFFRSSAPPHRTPPITPLTGPQQHDPGTNPCFWQNRYFHLSNAPSPQTSPALTRSRNQSRLGQNQF